MSVNMTVASARSGRLARMVPRVNSSTASSHASKPSPKETPSRPGSDLRTAPGMCSAKYSA